VTFAAVLGKVIRVPSAGIADALRAFLDARFDCIQSSSNQTSSEDFCMVSNGLAVTARSSSVFLQQSQFDSAGERREGHLSASVAH
jgi:hypothetical protein